MRMFLALLPALLLCSCMIPRAELHEGIRTARAAEVDEALRLGADVNRCDAKGRSPLCYAARRFKMSHLDRKKELLIITILLLKAGADPNRHCPHGTPLHDAVDSHNLLLTELYFRFGAQTEHRNKLGETPLWIAVEYRDRPMVAYLLSKGADPNSKDAEGRTPLGYLKFIGHDRGEVPRLLRTAGGH